MRLAARVAIGLLLTLVAAAFAFQHLASRALPQVQGELRIDGLHGPVEIVRDHWGVPHISAQSDEDAYFALGLVHAQDRLFQMELSRHLAQGRLAELFGPRALKIDRLFRTLDLHGVGRRLARQASPQAKAALSAYARGVNAWVARLDGRLPLEFSALGRGFAPVTDDDFLGVMGYMAWGLNLSWHFDPLYERLVAKVGPERAAELFPHNSGGSPSVYSVYAPGPAAPSVPRVALFELGPDERRLLELHPSLRGSNNWAVAPSRSASGHALLANDPHLSHGLPGIWYEAQLTSPGQDVIGMTLPGLPVVIIGHNRDVAWGFTNVMLDAADFFVERLDPADPGRVMYRGSYVPVTSRTETLHVRGGADEQLVVRSTPHGPLVTGLLGEPGSALSYRWTYLVAEQANDLDGFLALGRARNWDDFRAALRRFGAVAQNVVYADRQGHIGMQTCGVIPRLSGATEGTRLRVGWDGSQEWDGFWPFEDNPSVLDPPDGLLSSANNPTVTAPGAYYISSQWEPVDRITRIRELLLAKPKLSLADLGRIQNDFTLVSARELTPLLLEVFEDAPPDALLARALAELRGWGGHMDRDAVAPSLFAFFYRRLFWEIFEDELGHELCAGYRAHANLSAIMMRAVIDGRLAHWFDRRGTAAVEDRDEIFRRAFRHGVDELQAQLGPDVSAWRWGRLHTLELKHPLGRASRLLARYFNLGPFPVPGHTSTVAKMEFGEDDFRVLHGPSMRQLTDFADLNGALAILPAGQSGIPASPHYADMLPLWLDGRYHPLPMDPAAIDAVAEGRLRLVP